jgi:hypothetical protein
MRFVTGRGFVIARPTIAIACLALLYLTAGVLAAHAETAELIFAFGKRFSIEVPNGLCIIDANGHEADRKYFAIKAKGLAPENRLLALFADCPSVNGYRAGKADSSFERQVQFYAALDGDKFKTMPSGLTRAELIDLLAKLMSAERSVSISYAVRDIERTPKGEVTPPKDVGLLAKDEVAAFSGLLWRENLDGGKSRLMAAVMAMTAIDVYPVSANFIRPYAGRDSFDATLAEARRVFRSVTAVQSK